MEIVSTVVLLLVLVLFIVGLLDVIGALTGQDNSRQQITKRGIANIEQAASEGRKAIDDLSEQYLDDLFNQVTQPTQHPKVRR